MGAASNITSAHWYLLLARRQARIKLGFERRAGHDDYHSDDRSDDGIRVPPTARGSGAGDVLYAGTGASSQDTFAYTNLNESSLSHHDVIEGFKVGIDKINLSALDMPIADVFLSYGGNGANTIYVEKDPSTGFNSATDMILSVQASTNTARTYKDIIA
jgi:hypothetical protein